MRILIAPGRFGTLTPAVAAAALSDGWRRAAPFVEIDELPQSDGGDGLVDALTAGVADSFPLPDGGQAARLHEDGTVVIEAATVCADDSAGLGQTLADLIDGGERRIAVGLDSSHTPVDGGRAALNVLGAPTDADPGETSPADLAALVARARRRVAGTRVEVLVDEDRVLLGLQGACAAAVDTRGWSRAQAQERERWMGEWVDAVRRAAPEPVELLTGRPRRTDRLPGAGAGGGVGFLLALLGAQLRPGPTWVAERTDLAARAARADLVVGATSVYDWRQLRHSVPESVASAAGASARPAILFTGRTEVGRRETMSLGFAGTYALQASGPPRFVADGSRESEQPDEVGAVAALAARVARTWSPRPG